MVVCDSAQQPLSSPGMHSISLDNSTLHVRHCRHRAQFPLPRHPLHPEHHS